MKSSIPIAVASRSFSKNAELCARLKELFSNVKLNSEGLVLESDELVRFLAGAQGVIIGLEPITEAVLAKLPDLKVVSKYGVGLDNLDVEAIKKRGIKLGWSGGVNALSVAELTLTFALGLIRRVFLTSFNLSKEVWKGEPNQQLSGKTIGVIGCGHIGKIIIELLKPFHCRVLINDIADRSAVCASTGSTQTSLDELLRQSDIVSVHVPYDKTTHHLLSSAQISQMKKGAFLINTSRGNVVDEAALLEALKGQKLAGAAFDVFSVEPAIGNALLKLPNFFGTPHIGGSSVEAVSAMGGAAIDNLVRAL